jgi:hypothetical protein
MYFLTANPESRQFNVCIFDVVFSLGLISFSFSIYTLWLTKTFNNIPATISKKLQDGIDRKVVHTLSVKLTLFYVPSKVYQRYKALFEKKLSS